MSLGTATKRIRTAWALVVLVPLVLVGIVLLHGLADGERALLAPSGPEETVLRAVRLAGFERAAVGYDGDAAVLRLDIPSVSSVPDIEIAWQAGLATLSSAYPRAPRYVVQLFAEGGPLAELVCEDADSARAAVEADDAAALRTQLDARLLPVSGDDASRPAESNVAHLLPAEEVTRAQALAFGRPENAWLLPDDAVAVDVHVTGAYLGTKNRAAGLHEAAGDVTALVDVLEETAAGMRGEAPGVRAPGPDDRALDMYVERLRAALARGRLPGGDVLLADVLALGPEPGRAAVVRVRTWAVVAEALGAAEPPGGSVLGAAARLADAVAETPLQPGAPSDAVLAAADAARAPDDATEVRAFERVETLDASPMTDATGASLPTRVLRLHARAGTPPELTWRSPEGIGTAAAEVWPAYRRGDGSVYWLAGAEGDVALTDASLTGWAFSHPRAAVVDASRCGRVLAYFSGE